MNDLSVYLFGARCSSTGYPMAVQFSAALKDFEAALMERSGCEKLIQCVSNTIALVSEFGAETIDQLAVDLDCEFRRRVRNSSTTNQERIELEQLTDRQLDEAKIATSALILDREAAALKSGLTGYRRFLQEHFGTNFSHDVLETTRVRVLSFNYDRLFEFAFRRNFFC